MPKRSNLCKRRSGRSNRFRLLELTEQRPLIAALRVLKACESLQVFVNSRVVACLGSRQHRLGVHYVGGSGIAVGVFDQRETKVLARLGHRRLTQPDAFLVRGDGLESQVYLLPDVVEDRLQGSGGAGDLSAAAADLGPEFAAVVEWLIDVETSTGQPALQRPIGIDPKHRASNQNPRQQVRTSSLLSIGRLGHCLAGHPHLRPFRDRLLQCLLQGLRKRRSVAHILHLHRQDRRPTEGKVER
jgi:hypothetical protein